MRVIAGMLIMFGGVALMSPKPHVGPWCLFFAGIALIVDQIIALVGENKAK